MRPRLRSLRKKPPLRIQVTTLWDYPSQDYGEGQQGRRDLVDRPAPDELEREPTEDPEATTGAGRIVLGGTACAVEPDPLECARGELEDGRQERAAPERRRSGGQPDGARDPALPTGLEDEWHEIVPAPLWLEGLDRVDLDSLRGRRVDVARPADGAEDARPARGQVDGRAPCIGQRRGMAGDAHRSR